MTVCLGLASASTAQEAAEQYAPVTYESAGATTAGVGPTTAAEAPGTEYNAQYHYSPPAAAAEAAPHLAVRADNGNLATFGMFRSMRDSLADISHRVGRGFSSAMGLNQEAFQSGDSQSRVRDIDITLVRRRA